MSVPGHPKEWVGKEFQWPKSEAVIRVTAYEPGAGGKWLLVYRYIRYPPDQTAADQDHRMDPDFLRQHLVPYEPEAPALVPPFDISRHLAGQRPQLRLVPPGPRKDTH